MIYRKQYPFPLCADVFSEEDWMRIYYELSNYENFLEEGTRFGVRQKKNVHN